MEVPYECQTAKMHEDRLCEFLLRFMSWVRVRVDGPRAEGEENVQQTKSLVRALSRIS